MAQEGEGVGRYVVRVKLLDRPGALGQVASRIGAVGGDIVAVNILRRESGFAIDEFVIDLGGPHLVNLLRTEIHEVDGATVEEVEEAPMAPEASED